MRLHKYYKHNQIICMKIEMKMEKIDEMEKLVEQLFDSHS